MTTPPEGKPSQLRSASLMCLIWFGAMFTEHVSNILLPLSLHRLTSDPAIIGLILAINPAFGFIAQPLVGLLSDRVWTRFGRRSLFIIISAPIVAACVFWLPLSESLLVFICLVVAYQFFQDIIFGSDQPLLADLIEPQWRPLVVAVMAISAGMASMVLLNFGLGWVTDHAAQHQGEDYGLPVYWLAALLQLTLVLVPAFFIREVRIIPKARPPLTVRRYVQDILRNPMMARLMVVGFLNAFQQNAITGYIALYAVKTLGMAETTFGRAWTWLPLASILVALPVGWVASRLPKQRLLQFACLVTATANLIAFHADHPALQESEFLPAFFANVPLGLLLAATIYGFSFQLFNVVQKAFITEYYERDIVGQLQGAVNVAYASGRTLGLMTVPLLLWDRFDYSPIFLVSTCLLAVCFMILTVVKEGPPNRHGLESLASAA